MAGDTYYSNVSLLLHCDGTNGSTTFTDTSPTPKIITSVNATVDTTTKQFGTGALKSVLNNNYIYADGSSAFAFGTGDFTIELWYYPTTLSSLGALIDFNSVGGANGNYIDILCNNAVSGRVECSIAGTRVVNSTSFPLVINNWYHIALVRTGTTLKLFINGVQEAGYHSSTASFQGQGYIDDVRITKGVARYTSNFSVPTEAFPDLATQTNSITGSGNIHITASSTLRLRQRANIVGSGSIKFVGTSTLRKRQRIVLVGSGNIHITANSAMHKRLNAALLAAGHIRIVGNSTRRVTQTLHISEDIGVNFSPLYNEINNLFEGIAASSSISASFITKIAISEYLRVLDSLLNSVTLGVSESIGILPAISGIIKQLEYITETLPLLDSTQTSSSVLGAISDLIRIVDSVTFGLVESIEESLGLQALLDSLFKMVNRVLENLAVLGEDGSTYIHMVSLAESVSIDPNVLHSSIFNNALLDSFIISIPTASGQDTYLAYLLNTETNSVSTYTNYSFNCSTLFNGKYLLGNSSGLYEYGGTTDAGSIIEARIKTMAYNFGTSNLKQIPDMYIGGVGSDKMVIKVSVDNKASVYYKITNKINDLHTQRVKFGKGLIGRYFQFELITNSTDTDIESIEFYPVVLQRKI
jgi:hypothetical protein